ncbi:hypothetical protein CBER1_10593 [Cercospora berteroae]|uniref:D-isomer specific 2-hydroxyacid dehydrogenase NAD-binding domain-containing protein n=1 Tax=Cercospora berteroae TaxID=357750 RepID=A0A2S6BYU6_9PEZI|nr:hypothetical protein CBER1_10593 [Cercospora berteroae]
MLTKTNGHGEEHLLIVPFVQLSATTIKQLEERFGQVTVTVHYIEDDSPVPDDVLQRATILVTMFYLPDPFRAPNVKLVHVLSAGVDHVLSHPLVQRVGVSLTSSSGIHGTPIAEWAVMSWLVASRRYQILQRAQKSHTWDPINEYLNSVETQHGKHVGILGYGSIGRAVAKVAAALGMKVHAYTATARTNPQAKRHTGYLIPATGDPEGQLPISWHHGTSREALDKFLSLGLDHIVVAVPLTAQTTALLGAHEFGILSKNCKSATKPFITNIARGRVLDHDALAVALESGTLSGAALDMTDPHPLPESHPLWDVRNLQITPHISAMTRDYFPSSLDIVYENLERSRLGEPLVNEVHTDRGY